MRPEPLTGDASVVEGHGTAYVGTADAIEAAIERLRSIRDEDSTIAKAFDRVRDAAGDVSEQIAKARSRYDVTGQALVDYAAELRLAQTSADDAIDRWDAADAAAGDAEDRRKDLEAATPDDAAGDPVGDQAAVVAAHEAARQEAYDDWLVAVERKRSAAEEAEARIRAEVEDAEINDSFWDDLWGGITDLFEAIADAIVAVLEWIAAVVLVAVAVIVLAAIAVALIAVGGIVALLGGLLLAAVVLFVTNGGAEAFVRTLLRTGEIDAALMAGAIETLRTTAPGVLDWLIEQDAGDPELKWNREKVVERDLDDATAGDLLAELQAGNRDVDAVTGAPDGYDSSNSTMITVTEVVGADGVTRYRVNIPSTQQWTPGTDGFNDISSDAAAKFGEDPTQLERAVRQAMADAGVPDGAGVVLSGWSLGGITAANLAADPSFTAQYDVDAVVVAGSPVDDVAVPSHIPVLSVEHVGDPVPLLEDPSGGYHRDDPNRTRIEIDPPPDAPFVPHEGAAYETTLQQQGDLSGSVAQEWVERVGLDRYFSETETQHSSVYQRGQGKAG
ncbi:hypothetical protein [Agrococcus jejuensis]|uniref:Alpha/beta hydrolase family protein n=1 Tax=Agrococcus jejuensis TaxID=399736 RepID=A0A1G8BSD6_9MICO|nr:hypothetical protein [Agrococcus jejuensis]SDH36029.1 hypothetical protein SAMN04489720_1038 [Agrococcus jejuensis]